MWHEPRLGIVWLVIGHHKNGRRSEGHMHIALYHFGEKSLRARPHDLRDNDPNACFFDPHNPPGNNPRPLTYLGNLFEMLPYTVLTGHAYERRFNP